MVSTDDTFCSPDGEWAGTAATCSLQAFDNEGGQALFDPYSIYLTASFRQITGPDVEV